ncbi:hypothetical protein DF16_pBMB8240orf00013 (plasmid) [Bacillus thuringiensis serovar kurstaki str. YBT-1520]|nr:hypothetical protein DF16_pBMB8240orf00013 [Bacillus thuringiensis serovar kurstaki str. YBT-1520]
MCIIVLANKKNDMLTLPKRIALTYRFFYFYAYYGKATPIF